MKIIALQGKANSGKTTTIHLLDGLLQKSSYKPLPDARKTFGADFQDVYHSPSGDLIGVTSCGDTYDAVKDRLQDLVKWKCILCICACRTYDRMPPGTVAATKSFPGYATEFIKKTVSSNPSNHGTDNAIDADILFRKI
jgi:energy-coupling factor transporter ATP-binding protein EcfA2